jgi:hypothetical protein
MEWFLSFILTLIIEIPLLLFFLKGLPHFNVIFFGLLMNLISHVLLWFVMPMVFQSEYYLLLGESLVTLIEFVLLILFFPNEDKKMLLLVSFMINSTSFLFGSIIDKNSILPT